MTSKNDERKALEESKNIVAALGENSYVAAAFEGCLELAEANIEEGAAYSMKARAKIAERERDE